MNTLDYCPYCGSKQINNLNSLHVWSIEYECGLYIVGANGEDYYQPERECKNDKKITTN